MTSWLGHVSVLVPRISFLQVNADLCSAWLTEVALVRPEDG